MSAQETELPPRRDEACLSDLTLDRYAAGELAKAESLGAVKAHLLECVRCQTRARALAAEMEGPAHLAPALAWTPQLSVLTGGRTRAERFRRRAPLVAGALAAAVLAFVLFSANRGTGSIPDAYVGTKGGADLTVYVRRANGHVDPITAADLVYPGDQLRFRVTSHVASHVVVLGLDGAGHASLYSPAKADLPVRQLRAHENVLLDNSIELDTSPGRERLFALFCPNAPNVEHVMRVAQKALEAKPGHPEQVEVLGLSCLERSFTLNKGTRP